MVGAQGTLGVISEITLGLVPVEKFARMFVIYLNNLEQLVELVNDILPLQPSSIESFDQKTFKLALRFAPEIARLISKEENLFDFAKQMLPDFWIILKNLGLPKLMLLVEFTGNDENELTDKLEQMKNKLAPLKLATHIPKDAHESDKYWTIRRQSFNLLRQKVKGRQTVPFIDDLIVEPKLMPAFLSQLNAILDKYPQLVYTVAGHVGNGNFHIIPLMDMEDPRQRALIPEISRQVYDLTLKFNGSLSAEHNDGLIRGPYLKKMYGPEVFELFRQVKRIFDPNNIFNPHKKTDADLAWSMAHLKITNEHNI